MFNATTGSQHGAETSYVFGVMTNKLANTMHQAWVDFAKNPEKGPGWARMGTSDKDVADFGGEGDRQSMTMIKRDVMDSRCHVFWDAYDPDRPKS
jgi:hypothetical protein